MKLTKRQQGQYERFCKKHKIIGFGGMAYNRPCISLDLSAGNEVWITQRSHTGHNVGVHSSVEGDTEVTGIWTGLGWCMFGREFVETLTTEFRDLFPELATLTEGYDAIEYKANYIHVFPSKEEKLKNAIESAQTATEV